MIGSDVVYSVEVAWEVDLKGEKISRKPARINTRRSMVRLRVASVLKFLLRLALPLLMSRRRIRSARRQRKMLRLRRVVMILVTLVVVVLSRKR